MELRALTRLEEAVERLTDQLHRGQGRQRELSVALVKSREEVERLRAEINRYRSERSVTRKKVDALLRRFEGLDPRLDSVEG